MPSQHKFETYTVANGVRRTLGVLGMPGGLPPEAEVPKGPGVGGALDASSANHRKIAAVNRLAWALEVGDEAEAEQMRAYLLRIYRHELTVGFQTLPSGGMPESGSPTHDKQHYQGAAQLAWTAWYYGEQELLDLAVAWLRCKETLDRRFTAPSPSPKGKLPAILMPGYRVARDRGSKSGFKGGRDFVREEWYRVAVDGKPVPAEILANPVGATADDEGNVDMASLWYFAQLPAELQKLIGEPLAIPPLRDPITIQRRGPDFVASMEFNPAYMGEVQIYAGLVGGKEVYGFDGDPVPQLPGAQIEVLGAGGPVAVPRVQAPPPPERLPRPETPPERPQPTAEDLPPGLRALVVTNAMTLEAAVARARKNRPEFAKRWPEGS